MEKERERNIDVQEKHGLVASRTPPTRDLAQNLGMCADLESNQQPFGLGDDTQPTEPHWSGLPTLIEIADFHQRPPSQINDFGTSRVNYGSGAHPVNDNMTSYGNSDSVIQEILLYLALKVRIWQ